MLLAAPADVREALAEIHRLNAERNNRLRTVLRDTIRILNAHAIEPILLKGSLALLPNQYPHAGARMLSDLDLALHNAEPEEADAALRAAGYWSPPHQGPEEYLDCHHLAPLFHPAAHGYVEIHRRILAVRVPSEILSLTEVRAAAEPMNWDGLQLWKPSIAHRLLHNALHHQIADGAFDSGRYSLRQLLDFAQLRDLPAARPLDWPELLVPLDGKGLGEQVRAHFLVSARFFSQPLPAGLNAGKRSLRAERRMWYWLQYPSLHRVIQRASRLVTPSWYPAKYRYLRKRWAARRN